MRISTVEIGVPKAEKVSVTQDTCLLTSATAEPSPCLSLGFPDSLFTLRRMNETIGG